MEKEKWIFTFGVGQALAGYYVELEGSKGETREIMASLFGMNWAFQYPGDHKVVEEWGYVQLVVNHPASTKQHGRRNA